MKTVNRPRSFKQLTDYVSNVYPGFVLRREKPRTPGYPFRVVMVNPKTKQKWEFFSVAAAAKYMLNNDRPR